MSLPELHIPYTFSFYRSAVNDTEVKFFLAEAETFYSRKVICRMTNVTFDEQIVPEASKLYQFFNQPNLLQTSKNLVGATGSLKSMLCWNSLYRKDEFINPHKDRNGDVQVLLCLRNDGRNSEGLFCLETGKQLVELLLRPGDLLFFKASEFTHFTTPMIASATYPDPIRLVSVSRQFFN